MVISFEMLILFLSILMSCDMIGCLNVALSAVHSSIMSLKNVYECHLIIGSSFYNDEVMHFLLNKISYEASDLSEKLAVQYLLAQLFLIFHIAFLFQF